MKYLSPLQNANCFIIFPFLIIKYTIFAWVFICLFVYWIVEIFMQYDLMAFRAPPNLMHFIIYIIRPIDILKICKSLNKLDLAPDLRVSTFPTWFFQVRWSSESILFMVFNLDCHLDIFWNHPGDNPLGWPMREFVDWVKCKCAALFLELGP